MVGVIAAVGIGVAVVVLLLLVLFYYLQAKRNAGLGSPGIASRVRLTCPKCQRTFDFDYIPGASVTALRLGTGRYMACPLCHKFSVFEFRGHQVARTEPPPTA